MSINVTVSGNPVSINRGKMVTCDPNHAKKEFEKRRLLRLEQVRQQSRDIAEDVRNKVRKEKKKQMNQIEKEGKEKLKSWQNRKLLELQTQYKEALQELGTGHKQAVELEAEDEVLAEQNECNKEIANHRSQVAVTRLQIEKNKENMRKSIPKQQKKITRDIENARASLVSSIKKKKMGLGERNKNMKKRRKASADISITIPQSDSESEDEEGEYAESNEEEKSSEESTNNSEPRQPLDLNKKLDSKCRYQKPISHVEYIAGRISPEDLDKRKKFMETIHEETRGVPKQAPLDTRISDRIKRRDRMATQPDYCDIVAETHPTPFIESNTRIRDTIDSRYFGDRCTCEKDQTVCSPSCGRKFRYTEDDIPTKPPIKLKETDSQPSRDTVHSTDPQKVEFYDHPNRFSQEKRLSSKPHVEKITTESLEVIPNITSELEMQEKMKQRDKDARVRGQRALEKERIQRDYEEMLKKLPLLQKKERISQISRDKPEYHMTEERLKEMERRRQNHLDNAYSKLFPSFKPALVTLPKRHEKEPKRILDEESVQSLNVGKWDVDHEQKMFTAEEVQDIVRAFTEQQKPKDRQAKLKELLRNLKLQKEQLIKEIMSLPQNDSIDQLINDLNSFSDSDEKKKEKEKSERKRRREEIEKEASGDSTTESSSSSQTKEEEAKVKDKPRRRHRSEATKTPTPRKRAKIKSKRKVLILQNTSTQTTPKLSSVFEDKPVQQKQLPCSKLHVPCDCNKENEKGTEELCQIFIKLKDNEQPEVVVKSKEKEGKDVRDAQKAKTSPESKKIRSKSVGVGTDEVEVGPPEEKPEQIKVPGKVAPASSAGRSKKFDTRKGKSEFRLDKSEAKKDALVDDSDIKSKSWREQLSKNSLSTTSTSYYSPPDFQKIENVLLSSSSEVSKQSFYNLHKKPQQGNLHEVSAAVSVSQIHSSSSDTSMDPKLLRYIKKLLSKSRESIDNLTVSSSNVETPTPSVIEMESNNPLGMLPNVIKYFNLKTEDLVRELSYSPGSSTVHYNTSASASEVSQSEGDKSKGTGEKKKTSTKSATSKDSISLQYADITDSCSRRIATLASMISQIREEKVRMLRGDRGADAEEAGTVNVATSEKELSTAYLELPDSREGSKHSMSNSLSDDELHRRLMEIDLSLAKKLKKFSPEQKRSSPEDKRTKTTDAGKDDADNAISIDHELYYRLKRLMQKDTEMRAASSASSGAPKNDTPFVSFLSDIPKLPKLEVRFDADTSSSNHKRPPPSKGLTVAKKFNGDISLVPHELSTIIEADSQVSTRIGSSSQASPNASKASLSLSPRKDFQLLIRKEDEGTQTSHHSTSSQSDKNVLDTVTKVCITSKKSPSKQVETEKSKEDVNKVVSPLNLSYDVSNKSTIIDDAGTKSTISSKKSFKVSSSSSEDLETIEAMLKSMGMEWAISTVQKTQEALALTSSSSSLDFSSKKKRESADSGGSEVSLKDYLKKQILAKVSSSTFKSDASPASFSSEFSEMSSIQLNTSSRKEKQRTSTPVTASKSTSKSKSSDKRVVFSEGSDLSSVRDDSKRHSDKQSYCSLSDYSHSKND